MRTRAGRGEGPKGHVILPEAWDGTYDERVGTGNLVEGPWSVEYKDQDELEWMVDRGPVSAAPAAHVACFILGADPPGW
jgi:hypothetical protein